MAKFEDGEYMNLIWDGSPDAYYIKGHVSDKDGLEILADWGIGDEGEIIGTAQQKYGRWSTEGDCEWSQTLREYNKPGRGRFKITVFNVGIFAKQVEDNDNG